MPRKFNDIKIIEDIKDGIKIKDIMIKYGIKTRKTIDDIKNRIGYEPNGRRPIEEYIRKMKEIHNEKYEYPNIYDEYINSKSKVTIVCKNCKDIFIQTISHHIWSKSGCPNCKKVKPNSIEKILNKSDIIYGKGRYSYPYIDTEEISSFDKITIKCNICNHEFKQKVSAHINLRNGCNRCSKSKVEQLISQHLETNNVKFIPQKRFDECFYIKPLPFDFYLPIFNLCIEYDGELHFKKRRNDPNDDNLKFRRQKDNIKNNFCSINKINLERISYLENLEKKLLYVFKKYNIPNPYSFNNNLLYKIDENNKKECCICHEEKELKEYNKNSNSRDKHKPQCRLCQSMIGKKYRQNKKQLKIINICA